MLLNTFSTFQGLSNQEVIQSRQKYGLNQIAKAPERTWYNLLLDIFKEPMLVLLFAVLIIYLIVGNYAEGIFMFIAIIAVSAISYYQDNRSKKALEAIQKLNEPLSKVIRQGVVIEIPTHEIAVGDYCIIEEGKSINADGTIVYSNDFSVNESSLTGESYSVFKSNEAEDNFVYSGTIVVSGLAVFIVEKIGSNTKLGIIGSSVLEIRESKSPLQIQISYFIKAMTIIGSIVFIMVCAFKYYHTHNFIYSLLNGLTLAMSVLPEEIPVAFTTFMALGSWKLMQEGIIVKNSSVVETLGSTTVFCTDKTGTITQNTMHLRMIFHAASDTLAEEHDFDKPQYQELLAYAMWSSEPVPFDPMEKTLHHIYEKLHKQDERKNFQMIHEYPFSGRPPMMTHLFENSQGKRIIASKGAPEAILEVSSLSITEQEKIKSQITKLSLQGFRILGVGKAEFEGKNLPTIQQDFHFEF